MSRSHITLLLACALSVGAMLAPGVTSPQARTASVERGAFSVEVGSSTVTVERSTAIEIKSIAQASGSRLGRIPECSRIPRKFRPPLSKREKRRLSKRMLRCAEKQFRSVDQVVVAFLDAVVDGDGDLACRLLTPSERDRLGGAASCPQRVQTASASLAGRSLEFFFGVTRIGKRPQARYVAILDNPREAVLLELGAVNNHWRLSNVHELVP